MMTTLRQHYYEMMHFHMISMIYRSESSNKQESSAMAAMAMAAMAAAVVRHGRQSSTLAPGRSWPLLDLGPWHHRSVSLAGVCGMLSRKRPRGLALEPKCPRSIGQLVGRSVSPSVGRSVSRSAGRSVDRLVGRSVCWSVGRLVCRSVGRPAGRQVGRSVVG